MPITFQFSAFPANAIVCVLTVVPPPPNVSKVELFEVDPAAKYAVTFRRDYAVASNQTLQGSELQRLAVTLDTAKSSMLLEYEAFGQ